MSDLLQRISARARRQRLRRSAQVAIGVGVLALVVLLGWVVLASPLLAVDEVEVEGVNGPVAASVRALAEEELDTPLARVDLDALREKVEAVPQVAAATVTRSWPSTLRVEVDRRDPAAYVPSGARTDPRTFDVVDRTGVVISTEKRRPSDLPRVSAPRDTEGVLDRERVADALAVLDAAPAKVRKRTDEVEARTPDDVRLMLSGGVEVHWGSAGDLSRKADVLAALMKQKASVYDVSAPDLPTTRS